MPEDENPDPVLVAEEQDSDIEGGDGYTLIHPNIRTTLKLIKYGFTPRGGRVAFVIEAHEAFQTEVFYSWVTFPAVN